MDPVALNNAGASAFRDLADNRSRYRIEHGRRRGLSHMAPAQARADIGIERQVDIADEDAAVRAGGARDFQQGKVIRTRSTFQSGP